MDERRLYKVTSNYRSGKRCILVIKEVEGFSMKTETDNTNKLWCVETKQVSTP